jgi:hypothetical protein
MERYGQPLGKKKLNFFVNAIKNEKAKFISRHSNSRTIWDVQYEDVIYRVVYSDNTKDIVTVLPRS